MSTQTHTGASRARRTAHGLALALAIAAALAGCRDDGPATVTEPQPSAEARRACDEVRATVRSYGEALEQGPSARQPARQRLAALARECAEVMHRACVEGTLDPRCHDDVRRSPSGWTQCLIGMNETGGAMPERCLLRSY